MSIILKDKIEDLNYEEIYDLLKNNGKSLDYCKKAFSNTNYFVLAYKNSELVGVVRALVDGDEWSILYDLYAKDLDYSILNELLNEIISKLGKRHIFTYDNSYDISFYENRGFLRTKLGFTYDFGRDNDIYLPQSFRYPEELFIDKKSKPTKNKSKYDKSLISIQYKNENNKDYKRINEILSKAFNRERDINNTIKDFEASEYYSYAYVDSKLVGVSRAITDKAFNAFILNVGIDPDYQGLGIGYNLVLKLGQKLKENGYIPFLHTHPGAVGFYTREGFRRNKYAYEYIHDSEPIEVVKLFDLPKGFRFIDEI